MQFFVSLLEYGSVGVLLLRIVLGVIFITHGYTKLFRPAGFAHGVGLPVLVGFLVGFAETFGGLGVLLGFYTPISALAIVLVMFGALYFKIFKWHVPFADPAKNGWEFDLMLLALGIALILIGPGVHSMDSILMLW